MPAAGVGAPGLTLMCRGSKASPLVITAHRMRAFLLRGAALKKDRCGSSGVSSESSEQGAVGCLSLKGAIHGHL